MKKLNYAVVGLGHIAQVAVLPAFKNSKASRLYALVSGDKTKRNVLSKRYGVKNIFSYEDYDRCLMDQALEAVYIALPNHMHKDFALRAIQAGKHVLCEKPLAVTSQDAMEVVSAARRKNVKLMTAYRLHLDPNNLKAIQLVHSGRIGEIRVITSEFGHQVKDDNIRAEAIEGGSPLHDLGIYCINAARYLMKDEPTQVFAMAASPADRLPEIHQTVTATLKFPHDRIATFTCSFALTDVSNFRVIGDRGNLFLDNPYEYTGEVKHQLTVGEKKKVWTSKAGDQFAAELQYFSKCVFENKDPEPSGLEGVVDLKIIEALMDSLKTGKIVKLKTPEISRRPTVRQQIHRKAHRKPQLVHAEPESR